MPRLLTVLIVAGIGTVALADPPKGTATVEQLIKELGDPDFATRERATAAIRALGPAALPAIQRATTSDDPEIRRRAATLLPALKAQAVLAPRRITLKRDPATLTDTLKEITRQTGYSLGADEPGADERTAFEVTDLPFWEAVELIASRTGRSVAVGQETNIDLSQGRVRSPFVALDGAFRVELTKLHEDRDLDFTEAGTGGAAGKRDHRLTLKLSVLTEPRFIILSAQPAQFIEALDDLNGKMVLLPVADTRKTRVFDLDKVFRKDFQFTAEGFLGRSPKQGTKLRSLSGVLPVHVVVDRRRVIVPNVTTTKQKEFRVGSDTLTIQRAEVDPTGRFSVDLQVPPDNDNIDKARWHQRVIVEDMWGNQMKPNSHGSGTIGEIHHISLGCRQPQGWLNTFSPNLVVEDWEILEHKVRFAFKDVPLP